MIAHISSRPAACFKNLPAWTDERRAKTAELTRSTGPRSPEGKAISSKNGYRGGKRETLRALHRKGRAIMKDFDAACLELEGGPMLDPHSYRVCKNFISCGWWPSRTCLPGTGRASCARPSSGSRSHGTSAGGVSGCR